MTETFKKDYVYYKHEGLDRNIVTQTYNESLSMSMCSTYQPTIRKVESDLIYTQWDSSDAKEKTYE
jgi:hypothetical protein